MNLNDQVNTQSSTTGTSTTGKTTTSGYSYTYSSPQQGWECPRCGRINAPWMSQCFCNRSYWYPTWTSDHVYVGDKPEWWKDYVTCNPDTFKVHPETTIYTTGGSDYKTVDGTYVNVGGTQSNKVDPNVTVWSCTNPDNCNTPHYSTFTNQLNNIQEQLDKLKETK